MSRIEEFAESITSFFLVFDGLFLHEEDAEDLLKEVQKSLEEKISHNETALPLIMAMGGNYDSDIDRAKVEETKALLNLIKARKKITRSNRKDTPKKQFKCRIACIIRLMSWRREREMKIKNFLKAIWELPQNALGLIVKKVCKGKPIFTYKGAKVYSWNIPGGMSLGKHIFVPFKKIIPESNAIMRFVKHEYGHTLQSKKLGWLYLIVIGLPSLGWAWGFEWFRALTGTSYYAFYTESWANELGGVEGSENGLH